MTDHSNPPSEPFTPQRFSTFLGVYTPSVLTILGVMMYLRFGWPNDDKGLAMLLWVTLIVAPINKSIIISRLPEDKGLLSRQRIDVW